MALKILHTKTKYGKNDKNIKKMNNLPCPFCKKSNRQSAKFCRFCGSELSTLSMSSAASISEATATNESAQTRFLSAVPAASSETKTSSSSPSFSDYIGLSEIRRKLSMFISTFSIRQKQKNIGMEISNSNSILVFSGEAGTGKSLVANCFIEELKKSNCLSSSRIEKTTAHKMQRLYPTDAEIAKYLSEQNFGVLLVDEIHTDESYLYELLLGLSEKQCDTVCILIGIKDRLEKFFSEKDELADLADFYNFPDVDDENLTKILEKKLRDKGFVFGDEVKDSFYLCVKEARHNKDNVYKNGWIVEKDIIKKITEKQAARLRKTQSFSEKDLKQIAQEDLPAIRKIQSTEEILLILDGLIGMENVKKSVRELCQTIQNNIRRKSLGINAENPKIHIVLTGNPGTGKTTVARILGKLFYAMKLLPSDRVIETSGLDLTAGYVGQTKDKVNELCDKATGGVLFIDEAYYLAGTEGSSNPYGSEAVGTLLKRMEDDRGKFVIIAAGYKNEMQNFLRMNPGLESRFEHKIHIEDYTEDELFRILLLNVEKAQFTFDEEAKKAARIAVSDLCKNKDKNFANARAVRNLFDTIKTRMDSRLSNISAESLTKELLTEIKAEDIPYEKKNELTSEAAFAELNELIGMGNVKQTIRELYDTIKINLEIEKLGAKAKKPEIHIALTGNPGTGKTTVARILGKLLCSIGLLSSDKVIETDRSKIVAKFVGHTAQNMQRLCDDATGGILFIDEVYTLAKDDFGREATDTLMKRMEDDRGKFIVVVAGYKDKMNEWMATNEGLSSRFTHHIHIEDYSPAELYELFCLFAKKENLTLTNEAKKTCGIVIDNIWQNRGKNFANGRTIRKLFDSVVRKKNSRVIVLNKEERTKEVLTTIEETDF